MRALLLLLALLLAPGALADWQTRSWSRWEVRGESVEALFGIERAELRRLGLPEDPAWLLAELRATLSVRSAAGACALARAAAVPGDPAQRRVRLGFRCAGAPAELRLGVRALLDAAPNPMHYAVLRWGDGARAEALFTRAAPEHGFRRAPDGSALLSRVLADYLVLGFGHILAGADHVAFLLCMLLVSPRLGHRVWMVTGFTLGHSLTLSLAALGLLQADTVAVEALIGFTVALLAAESLGQGGASRVPAMLLAVLALGCLLASVAGALPGMPRVTLLALLALAPAYLLLAARTAHPVRLHLGMTAVFGLVHGLGFAGVLRALGLPPGQQGWALAGFNLGVELGQLVLLLAFALVLGALGRVAALSRERLAERVLGVLLCAVGVYWFVGRSAA